jgi:hypothetical protein
MSDERRQQNIFQYNLSELNLDEQREWAAIIGLTALSLSFILGSYNKEIPEIQRQVLLYGGFLVVLSVVMSVVSFTSLRNNRKIKFEINNFGQQLTHPKEIHISQTIHKYVVLWVKWLVILIFLTITSIIVDSLKPLFTESFSPDIIVRNFAVVFLFSFWAFLLVIMTYFVPGLKKLVDTIYGEKETE